MKSALCLLSILYDQNVPDFIPSSVSILSTKIIILSCQELCHREVKRKLLVNSFLRVISELVHCGGNNAMTMRNYERLKIWLKSQRFLKINDLNPSFHYLELFKHQPVT